MQNRFIVHANAQTITANCSKIHKLFAEKPQYPPLIAGAEEKRGVQVCAFSLLSLCRGKGDGE
jgi:hypothetical protein